MSNLPTAFATAKADRVLGIWLVSWSCWECRTDHHYAGGPITGPPRDGYRVSPCGRAVMINTQRRVES